MAQRHTYASAILFQSNPNPNANTNANTNTTANQTPNIAHVTAQALNVLAILTTPNFSIDTYFDAKQNANLNNNIVDEIHALFTLCNKTKTLRKQTKTIQDAQTLLVPRNMPDPYIATFPLPATLKDNTYTAMCNLHAFIYNNASQKQKTKSYILIETASR
jgi:hypothetical protein